MKTFIATTFVALVALLATPAALAAGGSGDLQKANVDVSNQASLQRGARLYMNYCMACHSTEYMRYNRVGRDIGLTEEQVEQNFIFVTDEDGELVNPGSLMKNAMTKDYADEAFGVTPPDLTLTTRIHGEDWVYTFLKSFYIDEDRRWVPTTPSSATSACRTCCGNCRAGRSWSRTTRATSAWSSCAAVR